MPSRLASTLLAVPRESGRVGDVLWKNADLPSVEMAGCAPTDELFNEFVMLLAGPAATALAQLTPAAAQVAKLASDKQVAYRLGAARNPSISDAALALLASDSSSDVATAAQEAINARTAAMAAFTNDQDASKLFELSHVEGIRQALESDADATVGGLLRHRAIHQTLTRLAIIDPELHDHLLIAWLAGSGPLDVYAINWALARPLRRETFLDDVPIATLRRRVNGLALATLTAHGYFPKSGSQAPSFASIEAMTMVLPMSEVAGLLVASDTPVDSGVADQILLAAAPSMVANYFVGACTRRPSRGDVTRLIKAASLDKRAEWATALTADPDRVELVGSLPWAGELLLMGSLDWLQSLDSQAVVSLDSVLRDRLADVPAAWDMALALAEEWESTLFDLLEASAAMESETV